MIVNHNLTESDIGNVNILSPLEHQIRNQDMRASGWDSIKLVQ